MVNFSANNLSLVKKVEYDKANVFILMDNHTKRTYKFYDYSKSVQIKPDIPYCVSGKINSANNQLYLIIENSKIDKKNFNPLPVIHEP